MSIILKSHTPRTAYLQPNLSLTRCTTCSISPTLFLLQAIDANKYHGYITLSDITEGRYYLSASEFTNGDLTEQLQVVSNNVDTSKVGTYEITYKVYDKAGASTNKTVTVTVTEKEVPPTPDKPVTPDDPTTPDTPVTPDHVPPTGDHSHLLLWGLLCVLALSGLVVLLIYSKKRNKKK